MRRTDIPTLTSLFLLTMAPCSAATLTVGPGQTYATIASAIAASTDGDVVAVQAGTYVNDFAEITTAISLVAVGGRVTLQASGALFFYTDYPIIRWDQAAGETGRRVDSAARAGGRPLYAVLFPFERHALADLPGIWVLAGNVDDVTVWRRE